jgi:hypothetical protein
MSNMIRSGLTSVTFRQLGHEAIIELAAKAGLDGIEWAGDVHAPPGDAKLAKEVRERTEEAGLRVASYGSYYRCVESIGGDDGFEHVLEVAVALGAPLIRVWPGRRGSVEANLEYRRLVGENLKRVGDTAARARITIGLEFHSNTLTDTVESALELVQTVSRENVKLYWQPSRDVRLESLNAVAPWLANLHVFHWESAAPKIVRKPLLDGYTFWKSCIDFADQLPGDRYALLEFVRGDDPDQFLEDAATLKRLLAE